MKKGDKMSKNNMKRGIFLTALLLLIVTTVGLYQNCAPLQTASTSSVDPANLVNPGGPTVTWVTTPQAQYTDESAIFRFTVVDPDGVQSVSCALDQQPTSPPCQADQYIDLPNLNAGTHIFTITATDNLGDSSSLSHSWTILEPVTPEPVIPDRFDLSTTETCSHSLSSYTKSTLASGGDCKVSGSFYMCSEDTFTHPWVYVSDYQGTGESKKVCQQQTRFATFYTDDTYSSQTDHFRLTTASIYLFCPTGYVGNAICRHKNSQLYRNVDYFNSNLDVSITGCSTTCIKDTSGGSNLPPVIYPGLTPNDHLADESVKINFTVEDSNLASVSCTLDSATHNCQAGQDIILENLELGLHTYIIKATDTLGAYETLSQSWYVIEE